MSIINLLEQIKNDEIVLPAIQRDFVWSEGKAEKLLDSIMRSYPIGIILLWETYNNIQYRSFVKDYRPDDQHTFYDNIQSKRLKLVLDGQQRLQSLYIALYGTYEGKHLYFDVLSGHDKEDFEEDKFVFRFLTLTKADELNKKVAPESKIITKDGENQATSRHYCRVQDLLMMGARERTQFGREVKTKLKISDDDEARLVINLSLLRDALTADENILKTTTLDENKLRESPDRKSESDVLEAFVRINREGMPLSRSDLIFSMLRLNWQESAETLPDFVNSIKQGNSFELDTDFVIRCLFAVSDLGTKFDIDILRKRSNVQKIKDVFQACCDAIRSTVDFIQNECWIANSKLLRGDANLVPLVYYLFHTKNHQVPNNQIDRVRKALYLFGFTAPFSRYADSRLGKFIYQELKPLVEEQDQTFPLESCIYWVYHWEGIENYGSQLLQSNPALTLHLVQHRSGAKVHYKKNVPDVDHIFPQSVLRQKKYNEVQINHFANLWILAKGKNQNKSNKHPKDYFADVSDAELQRVHIDRNLLDYKYFKAFLKRREELILEHVRKALKLSKTDFDVRAYWEI